MSAATFGRRARTGACQAPHTTAMFSNPSFSAWRMPRRIHASRRRVSIVSGHPSSVRSAVTASRIASKNSAESLRSSTRSFHQRSPSLYPSAFANHSKGSAGRPDPARPPSGPSCSSGSGAPPASSGALAAASLSSRAFVRASSRNANAWEDGKSKHRTGTPFSNRVDKVRANWPNKFNLMTFPKRGAFIFHSSILRRPSF